MTEVIRGAICSIRDTYLSQPRYSEEESSQLVRGSNIWTFEVFLNLRVSAWIFKWRIFNRVRVELWDCWFMVSKLVGEGVLSRESILVEYWNWTWSLNQSVRVLVVNYWKRLSDNTVRLIQCYRCSSIINSENSALFNNIIICYIEAKSY